MTLLALVASTLFSFDTRPLLTLLFTLSLVFVATGVGLLAASAVLTVQHRPPTADAVTRHAIALTPEGTQLRRGLEAIDQIRTSRAVTSHSLDTARIALETDAEAVVLTRRYLELTRARTYATQLQAAGETAAAASVLASITRVVAETEPLIATLVQYAHSVAELDTQLSRAALLAHLPETHDNLLGVLAGTAADPYRGAEWATFSGELGALHQQVLNTMDEVRGHHDELTRALAQAELTTSPLTT